MVVARAPAIGVVDTRELGMLVAALGARRHEVHNLHSPSHIDSNQPPSQGHRQRSGHRC